MAEAPVSADRVGPPPEHTQPALAPATLPEEISRTLDAAIRRSVDEALRASGVTLAAPEEQAVVQRVSREVTVAVQQTVSATYNGPLPPPQMLEEFERAVPGLSRQIISMALAEQGHRHGWEKKALWNDIFMQSGALFLGWVIAGVCALGAFVLGMNDKPVAMGILLGVPAIQMIKTIIHGNSGKEPDQPVSPTTPAQQTKAPAKKQR